MKVPGILRTLRFLVTGSVLVVGMACASGKGDPATQSASPATSDKETPTLMSIHAVSLPTPRLLLDISGTPRYTSYNPQPDVFVIDLPRTIKGNGLTVPSNLPEYVASIAADQTFEASRPVTRVTVRFNRSMRASAAVLDGGVEVRFQEPPAQAADLSNDSVEQIPVVTEMPLEEAMTVGISSTAGLASSGISAPNASTHPSVQAASLPLAPPPANKATKLSRVSASGSGRDIAVTLETNGAVEYSVFKLTNPVRLVVDLKGVANQARERTLPLDSSTAQKVRISQFKAAPNAVTRVVVDLETMIDYRIDRDGKNLRIVFGSAPMPMQLADAPARKSIEKMTSPEVTPPTKSPARQDVPVKVSGEPKTQKVAKTRQVPDAPVTIANPEYAVARVAAMPPEKHPEKVFEPVARQVVNSPAPQEAPRRVAPAPTPLPQVPVRRNADDVFSETPPQTVSRSRTTTDLSGGIKPGGSRTLSSDEHVFTGEPISLHLKDADIKDVLRTFSQLTGLNIAIDPQVAGTVTVDFEEVPWDQALELILKQNGLAYDIEGNVMRVGTLDRLATEQASTRKREEEKRLNVPTTSVARRLSYAKAESIQQLLSQIASPRGKILVDTRTNQIVITDIPEALRLMLNMIDTVDIPTPQVIIEARIVETTKSFKQQFGFRLGFTGNLDPALGTGTGLAFPNRVGVIGGPFDLTQGNPVIQLTLGNVLGTFDLDLLLAAAESEGLARIISAPRIATQDNQSAEIQSGIQIPFQTRVNFTTTVAFVDATLRLTVTPQITAEDTVIMDISVQKVEPAVALDVIGANNVPLITRRAQTRLMVRDGGTAVIGGIYQSTDNTSQNRVPFLHEIPVLGNLFKNRNIDQRHDELLIFITPRIVRTTSA
ncbi:MAG: type IV pilus secretin PilQ [Acidobacteriota bacterium]